MTDLTREEMGARFGAADARMSAHEARAETRYTDLANKIERLTEIVQEQGRRTETCRAELVVEGRNTRASIIVTLIAAMLAFAGAMWTAQANLLATFQAGLARQAIQAARRPRPATDGACPAERSCP